MGVTAESLTAILGGTTIRVRAPATSANLGPGFDCLGLALDLWNDVTATFGAPPGALRDESGVPVGSRNLVDVALRAVFREARAPIPAVRYASVNRIPFSRGLGSSAAAIVSGVLLANEYLGTPYDPEQMLRMAATMEGHPDNVAPALLGGPRVAIMENGAKVLQLVIPLPRALQAALFVPDFALPTEEARAVLPGTVPFADALFNVGRVSLLVAALAAGEHGMLREGMRDRLHQPYRASLFPAGQRLRQAAHAAGALGACISGAGPTVLALCEDIEQARTVQAALATAARQEGVVGTAMALPLTAQGAHVVRE